jgi:hypothetical protein
LFGLVVGFSSLVELVVLVQCINDINKHSAKKCCIDFITTF